MRQSLPLYMKYSLMAAPAKGAMYCIDADADAGAETMVVYSMAPYFVSFARMSATVESFCPMAT